MTATITGFGAAWQLYRDLGWTGTIKLKAGTKGVDEKGRPTVPSGFTGRTGVDPSFADCHAWAEEEPDANIALRLPADVIGIDEDRYNGKPGEHTVADAEKRWGRLPYSPKSTSRGDGSGIRLYRIPTGAELIDRLGPGVEIIQRHHRFVVCWPSIHPEGRQYRWLGIDASPLDTPPAMVDIPDLPGAWVEGLRKPDRSSRDLAGPADPSAVTAALTEGEPSPRVQKKLGHALIQLHSGDCRHDATRDHVLGLLRLGKQGEPGVQPALSQLHKAFCDVAAATGRAGGREHARNEFSEFINGDRVPALLADRGYDDPAPPEPPPDLDDRQVGEWEPIDGSDVSKTGHAAMMADRVLTRSALLHLPDPQPLIGNVLDQATVALLYGRWGTGKSFIALDWAASVATARPWQGRRTEQRRVLYVAAEGAFGLKGRLAAWETGWHCSIDDGTLDVLPEPVNLTHPAQAAQLAALIADNGYGFVIVDTLARCMVGADENSAKDCGMVVDTLHRLRQHTPDGRGTVLAVHHTGKDGKTFRGSSVFEAGADTVYAVSTDGGLITLDREKRKDGPQTDRHDLKLDPIEGSESCVISVHRGVDKPERADRLLSTFVHHFSHTGASKSELRNISDMPSATFHRALSDLLQCGDLVNEGTSKRPFYRLAHQ